LINTNTAINDKLIQLQLTGKGNMHTDYPTANATLNIQQADLLALGFAKDSLTVTTFTKIDINNTVPQKLDGIIRIDSAVIQQGSKNIKVDSILLVAAVKNDSTVFHLTSPFADAHLQSTVYYNEMLPLINQVLHNYFPDSLQSNPTNAPKGWIKADAVVKPHEVYQSFIKNLSFDNNITAKASITNTNTDSVLQVQLNVPYLQMNTITVGSLNAAVNGKGDSLQLAVNIDTLKEADFTQYAVTLNGSYAQHNMRAALAAGDENKKEQFRISATANQTNDVFTMHIGQDLLLNYRQWLVSKDNNIRFAKEGFNVQHVDIKNKEQRIFIRNENENYNANLLFDLDDFKLSNITSLFDKEGLHTEATINATIKIFDFKNAIPAMDGFFEIDSLVYQSKYVGNIDVEAKTENGGVAVTGKMVGNVNNVDMAGSYNANNLDIKINLNPLAVASIEPFTANNLTRSTGSITGPITAGGPINDIRWNGELRFDKVQTTATTYGTVLKIDNQK